MKRLVKHRGLHSETVSGAWYWIAGIVLLAVCFAVQAALGISTNCGGLVFNRLQASSTNLVLEWFSQSNATYEIASVTNLTSTNWVSLASLYPASSSNLTSFVDVGAATNKAKFYKVAQTGITIALCNSNTYSGVVSIPVQIGIPTNQILSGLAFLVDGVASRAMTDPQPPFSSEPSAEPSGVFDTTLLTNGWHTIQAIAEYPTGQNDDGGYEIYTSQVVNVLTTNQITFPDMLLTFSSALDMRATLDTLITNWTVTIVSTSNQTLRTYGGITSNGQIDVVWDGNDSNGVQFAGPYVDYIVNDPVRRRTYREGPTPGLPQNFLVGYQMLFTEGSLSGDEFENMISQIALTIGNDGGVNYNLQGDGTGVDGTTKITDTAPSWNSWALSMPANSTANLYYFGHGAPNAIGQRPTNANSGFYVNELEIVTGNLIIGGSPNFQRPFHFVFFDGCNTANGNWCEAFGIERMQLTGAGYTTNGLPPRAFVGWTSTKAYAVGGAFNNQHGNFIISFFNDWSSNGRTLQDALNRNLPSGFTAPRVYGATDLRWNQ